MRVLALGALLLAASCQAGVGELPTPARSDAGGFGDDVTQPTDAGGDPPGGDAGPPGGERGSYLCDLERPPGAPAPPPPPSYSGGACPALVPGVNRITSSGASRELILVTPAEPIPGERLPVGFLWHPLGSDAEVFLREGDLQAAIDTERFIAVLPQAKGDLALQWPWSALDSEQRVAEELRFFDDVFACVAEQYELNLDCVANGGVSSGGLWATQVGWRRGQYFSSLLSVSGGSGDGSVVKPWSPSPHKMPTLVLWGGALDTCVVFNFTDTSTTLESALAADGHFLLECVHNCGHAIPPFDPPAGKARFAPLWEFVLDHPYWLSDGESPYVDHGLPEGTPPWCGIGAGSAVPRTGVCDRPSEC